MRLVYYSLSRPCHAGYEHQWIQSIRSLRRYNSDLPVWLLSYDGISEVMLAEADRNNAVVFELGNYHECMSRNFTQGSVLAMYPTLHKFLALCELDTSAIAQVLYLDCDTFFFGDPSSLFDMYTACDWYAREAPTSRRCPHGYNPINIDEGVLDWIVQNEGLAPVAPFNAGVCLLNHRIWDRFADSRATYLDYVWRLLVGRHQREADGSDDAIRSAVLASANQMDHQRALPYPSCNFWIADEIALWLTLGRVPHLTQGIFSPEHVMQNAEFADAIGRGQPGIVSHYFSAYQGHFFEKVTALS